eukprot:TRINITY_DN110554_c0_g1_i1.p1 TRINITY_DN110554_c0_g1~~TRINITY_DN110554_c0_g1_i1.p1  ORF type:complete len:416 (-),score=88.22 TRINITY_DN110554_c0_g1_i1:255-1502(-)
MAAYRENGELWILAVRGEGIHSPEYRVGDLTSKFLGLRSMRPYLRFTVALKNGTTSPSQQIKAQGMRSSGDNVSWNEAVVFPLSQQVWDEAISSLKLHVEAFDERTIQSAVRGDPFIGAGSITLGHAALRSSSDQFLELQSRDGRPRGQIVFRAGLRAPSAAFDVIAGSASRPLAEVVRALAQVLAQPGGVEGLIAARPDELKQLPSEKEEQIRHMLRSWIARFCKKGVQLNAAASDTEALSQLSRLARSAQEIVAMCLWWDNDAADVTELTVEWLKRLFERTAGDNAVLNEARLRKLLQAGKREGGDPRVGLRNFGITLPEALGEEVMSAILARVKEAAEGQEEDIFTSEPIVTAEGRVSQGLSAVVRGQGEDYDSQLHVFLYDFNSIRQWQAAQKSDPCTREELRARDIIRIS